MISISEYAGCSSSLNKLSLEVGCVERIHRPHSLLILSNNTSLAASQSSANRKRLNSAQWISEWTVRFSSRLNKRHFIPTWKTIAREEWINWSYVFRRTVRSIQADSCILQWRDGTDRRVDTGTVVCIRVHRIQFYKLFTPRLLLGKIFCTWKNKRGSRDKRDDETVKTLEVLAR